MNEQLKGWMGLQTNLAEYAHIELPEDTIDGVIAASSIIILAAEPKAGKSMLAQSWAHSVATGTPWLGREVVAGGVAWVNPDGEHGKFLWERFNALERFTGEEIAYGETLAAIETFQLNNEQHKENLLNGARANLKLVIIDTLAAAAGSANLSNQHEVAPIAEFSKQLVKAGEQSGLSVIWLHHTTKADTRGLSGSQQIGALVSQHYSLTNNKGFLNLTLEKDRHGTAGLQIPLSIENMELASGRKSGVIVSGDRTKPKTSEKKRKALEAIRTSGEYQSGEQIPKATFAKELEAQGISNSTAYRTLVEATEDGLLVEHPNGNQKAYSFPISQSSPKADLRKAQDNFPPSPEPLSSGSGKRDENEEMEILL
jgi:RecA-family ATPase